MVGNERRLLGLILLGHFLGVAAGSLGRLELVVLDGDELGAERCHLLLGSRPHVGCRDHGAQTSRRSDRLQAGNARTHDEDLRRRNGAGGGHHHRHCPVIGVRGLDHRLVAGKVCLR